MSAQKNTPELVPEAAPPELKPKRTSYQSYSQKVRVRGHDLQPGLYLHGEKADKAGNVEQYDIRICGPLKIVATTRDTAGASYGLRLRFADHKGRQKEWTMPVALLAGSCEQVRAELMDQGLQIFERRLLEKYLGAIRPHREFTAATSTGWHDTADGRAFVLPDHTIGSETIVFQSEQAVVPEFAQRANLDGWRAEVAAPCVGNPWLILSASVALAGPLLHLTRLNEIGGAGIHLHGDSSKGKSTCARVAASVWGGQGMLRSWRATANGLEAVFASLNDTCVILDEIGEAQGKDVGEVVYALGNGQGKARANVRGNARRAKRWRLTALSTGEHSMSEHIEAAGIPSKVGQDVRLLSLPATERKHGAFDDLHQHQSGGAFADAVKAATEAHHGHAGPALVAALLGADNLSERLAVMREHFAATDGLEGRAAGTFALAALAGELATETGITGWPEGTARAAALEAFRCWRQAHGSARSEDARILESVHAYISRYESRFQLAGGSDLPKERAGFREQGTYWFFPNALEEASGGYSKQRAAKALRRAGWIVEHDQGRLTKKARKGGRGDNFYVIRPVEEPPESLRSRG